MSHPFRALAGACILFLLNPITFSAERVTVCLTTPDQRELLKPRTELTFGPEKTSANAILVNEHHVYQEIEGFGGALTDSSAWLINKLPLPKRDALLTALFSPDKGIGLSYIRLPMGASDFALSDYTYDDIPAGQSDPLLDKFSIEHDRAYIIPILKQALALNPKLKIMATPWSPPAWMKTSGSLKKGRLKPQYYEAYANYFVKFIQAYQAENITIQSMTIQNEPHHETGDYPSMRMEAAEQALFIKKYLGPAFAKTGITTQIIVWDHNWNGWLYPVEVLNDKEARTYVAGSAFHAYSGKVEFQSRVQRAHPDKGIYFTEMTSGAWAENWPVNFRWDMENLLIASTRNWGRTVIKWNIALDPQHGPKNGGCPNCTGIVTIDPATGAVAYNHDYYALGHASKFVRAGAYRIASSNSKGSGLQNVAFKNADGSKVLLVVNGASASETVTVSWGRESFSYALPGGAAATFTWNGATPEAKASPPKKLAAVPGNGTVDLSWELSLMARSYTVRRAPDAKGPFTVAASDVKTPEFHESGLANGSTFFYTVTAVNEKGESVPTAPVSARPFVPGAFTKIEAEDFSSQSGIALEECSDAGGGVNVGHADANDFLVFESLDFGAGATRVEVRVATGSEGGRLEFRLDKPDGALIGRAEIANTGGWQKWKTVAAPISGASGIHKVCVIFTGTPKNGGVTNFNWFRFYEK